MAEGTFSFGFFEASGDAGGAEAVAPAAIKARELPLTSVDGFKEISEVEIRPGISLTKGSISSEAAAALIGDDTVASSDLIPQKYEGGFKLWEGAVDLCRYLVDTYKLEPHMLEDTSTSPLLGKKVLELGCGHGLPGILCMLAGAQVHFQDFNEVVLNSLTMPNVNANLATHSSSSQRAAPRYFAGDWLDLGPLMSQVGLGGHYDLILTAETIYSTESQQRLLSCMKQVLLPPHGEVLVAAKSYYFGVGGGTNSFIKAVKADGVLESTTVQVIEDGSSNKREILKLAFPQCIMPYFL